MDSNNKLLAIVRATIEAKQADAVGTVEMTAELGTRSQGPWAKLPRHVHENGYSHPDGHYYTVDRKGVATVTMANGEVHQFRKKGMHVGHNHQSLQEHIEKLAGSTAPKVKQPPPLPQANPQEPPKDIFAEELKRQPAPAKPAAKPSPAKPAPAAAPKPTDASHPHAPAGSPQGGQFVSKGSTPAAPKQEAPMARTNDGWQVSKSPIDGTSIHHHPSGARYMMQPDGTTHVRTASGHSHTLKPTGEHNHESLRAWIHTDPKPKPKTETPAAKPAEPRPARKNTLLESFMDSPTEEPKQLKKQTNIRKNSLLDDFMGMGGMNATVTVGNNQQNKPSKPAPESDHVVLAAYLEALIESKQATNPAARELAEQKADYLYSMLEGKHSDPKGAKAEAKLIATLSSFPETCEFVYLLDSQVGQSGDTGGWIRYKGPRGGTGWKHQETGRIVYTQSPDAPGANRRKIAVNQDRARTLSDKVLAHLMDEGSEAPTADELKELSGHLPSLTVDQLKAVRNKLFASWAGRPGKAAMVEALGKHVEGLVQKRNESGALRDKAVNTEEWEKVGTGPKKKAPAPMPAAAPPAAEPATPASEKEEPEEEQKPIVDQKAQQPAPSATPAEEEKPSSEKVQKTLKEAYDHLCLFVEFRDKLVELPRLYHEAKKRMPSLTVEQFHDELTKMNKDWKVDLQFINEVHMADEKHLGIHRNDRLYYYARWMNQDEHKAPEKTEQQKQEEKNSQQRMTREKSQIEHQQSARDNSKRLSQYGSQSQQSEVYSLVHDIMNKPVSDAFGGRKQAMVHSLISQIQAPTSRGEVNSLISALKSESADSLAAHIEKYSGIKAAEDAYAKAEEISKKVKDGLSNKDETFAGDPDLTGHYRHLLRQHSSGEKKNDVAPATEPVPSTKPASPPDQFADYQPSGQTSPPTHTAGVDIFAQHTPSGPAPTPTASKDTFADYQPSGEPEPAQAPAAGEDLFDTYKPQGDQTGDGRPREDLLAKELGMTPVADTPKAAQPESNAPAKKMRKPAKQNPSDDLGTIIQRRGGINPEYIRKYYNFNEDIKEHGLLRLMNKNGRGLDDLAQSLHSEGHIRIPEGLHPDDHLLELLKAKAKSNHRDLSDEHERQYNEYIQAEQEAKAFYDAQAIAEARDLGSEIGSHEAASQGIEGDSGQLADKEDFSDEIAGWDHWGLNDKGYTPDPEDYDYHQDSTSADDEPTYSEPAQPSPAPAPLKAALDAVEAPHHKAIVAKSFMDGQSPEDRQAIADHVQQTSPEAAQRLADEGIEEFKQQPKDKAAGYGDSLDLTPDTPQTGYAKEPHEMTALEYATQHSGRMQELSKNKPRTIEQLYGKKGPTPEQRAEHEQEMKNWNREYRKASNAHKAYLADQGVHRRLVDSALAAGKPVPPEVLADYPDLAAKYGKSKAEAATSKDKEPWEMTRDEAIKAGIPASEWVGSIEQAWRDEKLPENSDVWKQANDYRNPELADNFRRAAKYHGKIVADQDGKRYQFQSLSEDGRLFVLTDQDGKEVKVWPDKIGPENWPVMISVNAANKGNISPDGGVGAKEIAESVVKDGVNMHTRLKDLGVDLQSRGGKILRDAVAKHIENIRSSGPPANTPSDMRQKAMDVASKNINPLPSDEHIDAILDARKADKQFQGEGRYEAEVWQKLRRKSPDAALPPLSRDAAEWLADDYQRDGKPVPPEVLADYPDLASKYGQQAPEPQPEPTDTSMQPLVGYQSDAPDRGPIPRIERQLAQAKVDASVARGERVYPEKDSTPAEPPKPLEEDNSPYTLSKHNELVERLNQGQVTPNELKAAHKKLGENIESIKGELSRMTVKELEERSGIYGRGMKKAQLVDAAARNIANELLPSDQNGFKTISFDPFRGGSYHDAVGKKLDGITTDHIAIHAEGVKNRLEAKKQRQDAAAKALTNPETYDELVHFVKNKGYESLTKEQAEKLDSLVGERRRAKDAEEMAKRAVVDSPITGGSQPYTIHEGYHTKHQKKLHIVKLGQRVDSATFKDLAEKARKLGGNYQQNSKWTRGESPDGFNFDTRENAERFGKLLEGQSVSRIEDWQASEAESKTATATRLRDLADRTHENAQDVIDTDRKVNTHRRAEKAAGMEERARRAQAKAETMRRVAETIENGTAKHLAGLRHGTHFDTLESMLKRAMYNRQHKEKTPYQETIGKEPDHDDIAHAQYPYPYMTKGDMMGLVGRMKETPGAKRLGERLRKFAINHLKDDGADSHIKNAEILESLTDMARNPSAYGLDKSAGDMLRYKLNDYMRLQSADIKSSYELRAALREYLPMKEKPKAEDPVKIAERDLIGKKIPGFFPTPRPSIDEMLQRADIKPGMRVLEPSAGKGDILDAIRENHPEASAYGFEYNSTLADHNRLKGHDVVQGDFLQSKPSDDNRPDRIVMNPPFEKGQDIEHVRHAYEHLKPGGKMVAIMSEGAFGRGDTKATSFRDWLDSVGGESEQMPEGSFAGDDSFRQTGVRTRMVTIEKPAQEQTTNLSTTYTFPATGSFLSAWKSWTASGQRPSYATIRKCDHGIEAVVTGGSHGEILANLKHLESKGVKHPLVDDVSYCGTELPEIVEWTTC